MTGLERMRRVNTREERKRMRGMVYEKLYHIQAAMRRYRGNGDAEAFRKSMRSAYGSLAFVAERSGFEAVAELCRGIIHCCEDAGRNEPACLELFALINRTLDWMLGEVDPRPDIRQGGASGGLRFELQPRMLIREFEEIFLTTIPAAA